MRRSERGAERPRALAWTDLGVDVCLVEELARDPSQAGVEAREAFQYDRATAGPRDRRTRGVEWRIDVGDAETGEPEQFRFQTQEALDHGPVAEHGVHHRLDDGWRDLVGEVRGVGDVAMAAHLAVDAVIQEERVHDRRERDTGGGEGLEQGRERRAPVRPVGVVEARQDLTLGQLLVAHTESEGAGELVVQLDERRSSAEILAGEEALLRLAQHVGPKASQLAEKMGVGSERGVAEQRLGPDVIDGEPFELEEDELRPELGLRLGRALLETERDGILGVRRGEQRRVESRSLPECLQVLVLLERAAELRRSEARDAATPRDDEGRRFGAGRGEVALEGGIGRPGVQLAEVPAHATRALTAPSAGSLSLVHRHARRSSSRLAMPRALWFGRARHATHADTRRKKNGAEGPLFPPPHSLPFH
jgi:hypothetical protein